MKEFEQEDVDQWVKDNNEFSADRLLDQELPGMRRKLNALDKRIRDLLEEIQEVFPDAMYYTASGGFMLVLGETHDDKKQCAPQNQRAAWKGNARIGDGDW